MRAPHHRLTDLAAQALLFGGGMAGYELVRGLVATDSATPFSNAARVIGVERALHVFIEPAVEGFVQRHAEPLMDVCVWMYLNAHFLVTLGALVFLYTRRRDRFELTRDTLLVAMAIALLGYALYPAAPPRLLPGYGFTDPVRHATGISTTHGPASLLVNPYAAIPSMHVCFALALGRAMARATVHPAARTSWSAYPLVIAATVVVTGNHLFADVLLGALTALVAERLALTRRRTGPARSPATTVLPA